MKPASNAFVSVLTIETFNDFVLANVYVGIVYYLLYFVVGGKPILNIGVLEYTNPVPKSKDRVASTIVQIKMGIFSLFSLLLFTTVWLWKVDHLTPYYGYWAGRENEFGLTELILQIFIYLFVFDTWFYLTHHLLHV